MFGVEHDMLAREILEVNTFELIEDKTIDIDSIEEMVIRHYQTPVEKEMYIENKINELVQAVNTLTKKYKV